MSHYKSNLRDLEFNLFEVFGRADQRGTVGGADQRGAAGGAGAHAVLGAGPYADVDVETARSVLAEVDRLAREDLAASYVDGDRTPPVFDPLTHTAPLPESFKKSYKAWMDAEYW